MTQFGRGNFNKYLEADTQAKIAAGWAEDEIENGRVGYRNGKLAPEKQRTMHILSCIQNPNGSDDYIWKNGDDLTENQYDDLISEWFMIKNKKE